MRTTRDLANVTIALGADVLNGRVVPKVANSASGAFRTTLSAVALAQRYGVPIDQSGARVLDIASGDPTAV